MWVVIEVEVRGGRGVVTLIVGHVAAPGLLKNDPPVAVIDLIVGDGCRPRALHVDPCQSGSGHSL